MSRKRRITARSRASSMRYGGATLSRGPGLNSGSRIRHCEERKRRSNPETLRKNGLHCERSQSPQFYFDTGVLIDDKPRMPKKPGTNPKGEFAFFNVVYEDGSQRSNRRVPSELLGGLDGDEPARAFIHAQDQEIADKGGRPALEIKSISRVGAKKK